MAAKQLLGLDVRGFARLGEDFHRRFHLCRMLVRGIAHWREADLVEPFLHFARIEGFHDFSVQSLQDRRGDAGRSDDFVAAGDLEVIG